MILIKNNDIATNVDKVFVKIQTAFIHKKEERYTIYSAFSMSCLNDLSEAFVVKEALI